jgi:hypothetical protein
MGYVRLEERGTTPTTQGGWFMHVEVIKHFKTDADGVHLRGMSTEDGEIRVEGHSKTLRSQLAEKLGVPADELQIVEVGKEIE